MSAALYVAVMCLAWIALLAVVIAIFHAQRWIDETIDEEMNLSAGGYGPANRGERREE